MDASNFEKILIVESKYRHLDTFTDDAVEDVYALYVFGRTNYDCSDCSEKDETRCLECAILYFERAKERMEDADAHGRQRVKGS